MHCSTQMSARRLRASTTALALGALASAAACSDDVTSPNAAVTRLPAGPQAALVTQSVTLAVRITDTYGTLAKEGGLKIKVFLDGSPTDTVVVLDNLLPDKDLDFGEYGFAVPARASYKVCAAGSGTTLVTVGFADECKTVYRGWRGSLDVGTVIAHRKPVVALHTRDMNNQLIGGATIGWTTTLGTQQTVGDPDNDGFMVSILPGPSTAVYCETKAPTGYQFVNPVCAALDVTWDQNYTRVLKHELLPKQSPIP